MTRRSTRLLDQINVLPEHSNIIFFSTMHKIVAQSLIVTTPEFHTTNHVKRPASSTARSPTPRSALVPSEGYKAIVHIYLFGEQDNNNNFFLIFYGNDFI